MKSSALYVKIVEWSEEDNCNVDSCPGLFYGGCHGEDEREIFAEHCRIVEEIIELYTEEGKPLPSPTAGKDYANKMLEIAIKSKSTHIRGSRQVHRVSSILPRIAREGTP